ncbi:ASCH domain-containing protein [Variovorax sp. LjRoot84]|uniref:ASCH domain-containing protein n=1 Tax=Variovorax sp. LjRoot84 TaxID=3342340 RepID=UPI003ECFFA47
MKALSIRQPWAWLIVHGHKDIENRTWRTRQRGTILVHASQAMTRREYQDVVMFLVTSLPAATRPHLPAFEAIECGGIVGQVDIVDCVTDSNSPWYMGATGFVLANAEPLPYRPFKGALGFFEVAP